MTRAGSPAQLCVFGHTDASPSVTAVAALYDAAKAALSAGPTPPAARSSISASVSARRQSVAEMSDAPRSSHWPVDGW